MELDLSQMGLDDGQIDLDDSQMDLDDGQMPSLRCAGIRPCVFYTMACVYILYTS